MVEFINSHALQSSCILLVCTFLLTYFLIPKIINVVKYRSLMDSPNERSSHKHLTPTFGGASFFAILIITLLLIQMLDLNSLSLNIIAGLTILLFTGLKDDLVVISAKAKLLGQIIAVVIFLFNTSFYEMNLHGFLGVYDTNPYLGYVFTVFIMLSIINAFNLIDGIDGLAASIGIISLVMYAAIFFFLREFYYILICASLLGSLLAFLRFNLSSKKKIFMGDTGSLIIGFIVSVMTIKFLNIDQASLKELSFIPQNSIFVASSILIFPLFDMLRIVMVRISKRKHPLLADKNHIHHVLLDYGNSHMKTSILISSCSLLFSVLFIYLTTKISNAWYLLGLFLVSYLIFLAAFFKLSINRKQ